jgi:phenol 2-monooxygenase
LDDTDISGRLGGGGYEKLGIHPTGALVVARPDGYIGMISSLEDAADNVGRYFKGFLKVCGRQ